MADIAESAGPVDRLPDVMPLLDYANVTGRPPSRVVRAAARLHSGVASVNRQHAPYAQAWFAANTLALSRPGPRWIVFGDSMSQGIGASSFDAGWVNQLHQLLVLDGIELPIVNLSASGARVTDLLAQQLPVWRSLSKPQRTQDRPDLVTVLIGSNDLMSRTHRLALPTAFGRLLQELPDHAVVATMPQPQSAAIEVNAQLADAASAQAVTLVDMRASGPPVWRGKLAADHFHPNDRGYADLAKSFHQPVLEAIAAQERAGQRDSSG